MISIPYGKTHIPCDIPAQAILTSRIDELASEKTGLQLVEEAMDAKPQKKAVWKRWGGLVAAVVLQINGINIGTLFTGLGVAGIIVGFALQDILKDLMMGTSIIWDKFFAVGDYICYNGKEWQVIEFNAKVTKLYDFLEDTTITISNRNITEIAKATKIVGVSISAPYDVPLSRIRPVMEEIVRRAKELPSVEDAQFLGTDEFADSSINYKIVLNCVDPSVKGAARRGTLDIVQEVFAEENISIPYPQMDVHMCK